MRTTLGRSVSLVALAAGLAAGRPARAQAPPHPGGAIARQLMQREEQLLGILDSRASRAAGPGLTVFPGWDGRDVVLEVATMAVPPEGDLDAPRRPDRGR